ncbi:uncharacterized protein LOC143915555 [Arctopsyche grandis]|uniref:uncharacterized protein LOC143915555 n=1 Tax=Arctopsyche grandis TaxID=121162 RepID=UPI00406D6F11
MIKGHNCEINILDPVATYLKHNVKHSKFYRNVYKYFVISKDDLRSTDTYRSMSGITKEKLRQVKTYPYMVHPFSKFRKWWEGIMLLFLFLSLLRFPIFFVYNGIPSFRKNYYIPLFFDIIYVIDVVMTFFTGYQDSENKIQISKRQIYSQYMIQMCYIDALVLIPFRDMLEAVTNTKSSIFELFIILKIFRIVRFVTYMENIFKRAHYSFFVLYTVAPFFIVEISNTFADADYFMMQDQLNAFIRSKKYPYYLQKRLNKFYNLRYKSCFFNIEDSKIMPYLAGQKKHDILMHSSGSLMKNVLFFSKIPSILLLKIVSCLKKEIFLTNDVIKTSGQPADCMYFVLTGTVAIYSADSKELCHLQDGNCFGEINVLEEQGRRLFTVVAVEPCVLLKLESTDFSKVIAPYPMVAKIFTENFVNFNLKRFGLVDLKPKNKYLTDSFQFRRSVT